MKIKNILLVGLSIILISSCQKENESLENSTYKSGAKLKRVLVYTSARSTDPFSIVSEYEYDKDDRISKITSPSYLDGEISGTRQYEIYSYNTSGQIIKIENFTANSNSSSGFINLMNTSYMYSENGNKEKELIEYPQIGSSEYTLFKYDQSRIDKAERYGNTGNLESFVINKYDTSGNLIKETFYGADSHVYSHVKHHYKNGLCVQSDTYGGIDMNERIREVINTYDTNNNLVMRESTELSLLSSAISFVLRYEYFNE